MSNRLCHKTQQLVSLAKQGDRSALDQLCGVYGERVLRIIRLRMGSELRSKLESMDLVQDVLMCTLKDLGDFTYTNEGDFLRWLGKIAENRIRDNLDKLHAGKRDIHNETPLYNDTSRSMVTSFSIADLAYGAHRITIEVTDKKNPTSTGHRIVIDAFDIAP